MNELNLNGIWQLAECEHSKTDGRGLAGAPPLEPMDAEVPGDVHAALFQAGRIKDPYYADNSKLCAWVAEKDWEYRTAFRVPDGFCREITELVFDGIDTYAEIFLNGEKIGEADNMFREFRFDVTEKIFREAENELIVRISSIKRAVERYPYQKYFACFNRQRVFARKAQCHFGWDWAPALPGTGIWRGVKLASKFAGEIESVAVRPQLDGNVAFFVKVDRRPQINGLDQSKDEVKIEAIPDELLITLEGHGERLESRTPVRGGKNFAVLKLADPKLWWPNGCGEPNLYSYSVALLRGGREIGRCGGTVGIREAELLQEPQPDGSFGFRFAINGRPVYCKGANWVPPDCFAGTIRRVKYERLIALAKSGNFNMLRVWGGGIYENDAFYELCDENGIMVWQDFMFACSDAPDDDWDFVRRVIPEAEYQVARLRNHPSIVYWCGGNEKTGSSGLKVSYGERLFHYFLRGVCGDLDGTRPYGAASPSAFSDLGNDQDSGDTHCNSLEASFKRGMTVFREEIEKLRPSFNSECAIQGPDRPRSVKRYIPEDRRWPLNDVWRFHYKDNPYNTLREDYLDLQKAMAAILFGEPTGMEDFLKKAMAAHAEILRAEAERQRARKWGSGGFMHWMFNDIWPTGTWASVDYYGLPKPAYYAVRRAFNPLLLSVQQLGGDVAVLLSNDLPESVSDTLECGLRTLGGDIVRKERIPFTLAGDSAARLASLGAAAGCPPDAYVFARLLGLGAGATFFPNLWRDVPWPDPGLSCEILSPTAVRLKALRYARMVNLNLPDDESALYSDNFFDMEAGEEKVVAVSSPAGASESGLRVGHWLTEWI
ncbi:MAG: hypothetical protein LBL83_04300 [Clostridiales bacterium]|jgi:beta-mannosidase|nr:hypothetical protein [Clostridiales bacterium]